jgi:hypothetical protein
MSMNKPHPPNLIFETPTESDTRTLGRRAYKTAVKDALIDCVFGAGQAFDPEPKNFRIVAINDITDGWEVDKKAFSTDIKAAGDVIVTVYLTGDEAQKCDPNRVWLCTEPPRKQSFGRKSEHGWKWARPKE